MRMRTPSELINLRQHFPSKNFEPFEAVVEIHDIGKTLSFPIYKLRLITTGAQRLLPGMSLSEPETRHAKDY